jgi:hypothetical protein
MIKPVGLIILFLLTMLLTPSSAIETYSATPFLEMAPVFPDGALSIGLGLNFPIVEWLGMTSSFAVNASGQLSHANFLDNHLDFGFYALVPFDRSSLIIKFTDGVYKINHLKKYYGEYFDPYYPGLYIPYEGWEKGSWTSGGMSIGLGFKADVGILSIALIPTEHLVLDQGSKLIDRHGTDAFSGDMWLPHDYNTTFIEIPLEIGINIE